MVTRIDAGSTMKDGKGRVYGNTCFFNCLQEGLSRLRHVAGLGPTKWSLDNFIRAGDWDDSMKGQMVDTAEDEHHLLILANSLRLTINVHTEFAPGKVSEIYETFVPERFLGAPSIEILKVHGRLHYNLLATPPSTGASKDSAFTTELTPLIPTKVKKKVCCCKCFF